MPEQITLFDRGEDRELDIPLGGGTNGIVHRQLIHTYDEIISLENLCLAWEEFIIGKKQKSDVQAFGVELMDNIVSLHESLVDMTYIHAAVGQCLSALF